MANGSLRELETYCEISLRLGYVNQDQLSGISELSDHLGRMLTRLRASLSRRLKS